MQHLFIFSAVSFFTFPRWGPGCHGGWLAAWGTAAAAQLSRVVEIDVSWRRLGLILEYECIEMSIGFIVVDWFDMRHIKPINYNKSCHLDPFRCLFADLWTGGCRGEAKEQFGHLSHSFVHLYRDHLFAECLHCRNLATEPDGSSRRGNGVKTVIMFRSFLAAMALATLGLRCFEVQ